MAPEAPAGDRARVAGATGEGSREAAGTARRVQLNGAPDHLAGAVARASFEHALDAMLLADDARRYTDANPAACTLLGLPYEEVLTRRLDDFVPEEARPSLDALWRDFLESGNQSGEFELVVADGSRRKVEFRATARVLPGCHLSVLRDLTPPWPPRRRNGLKGHTTSSPGSSSTSTRVSTWSMSSGA